MLLHIPGFKHPAMKPITAKPIILNPMIKLITRAVFTVDNVNIYITWNDATMLKVIRIMIPSTAIVIQLIKTIILLHL